MRGHGLPAYGVRAAAGVPQIVPLAAPRNSTKAACCGLIEHCLVMPDFPVESTAKVLHPDIKPDEHRNSRPQRAAAGGFPASGSRWDDLVLWLVATGVVRVSDYGNSSTEPIVLRLSMSRCAIAAARSG